MTLPNTMMPKRALTGPQEFKALLTYLFSSQKHLSLMQFENALSDELAPFIQILYSYPNSELLTCKSLNVPPLWG